jgi:hypothetical protein
MTVAQDVQKIQQSLSQKTSQLLVLLMAETDARLKMKSPVLYGRFRASWTIGVGQIDPSVAPEPAPGQHVATPEPRIPAITVGQTYYHANSLPYARRLEYGWSKKAPGGMVRIVAAEVPGIIAALVKQVGGP